MRRFGIACPKERKSAVLRQTLLTMHRSFGFDSRVVSAVGADADGDEILDVFARKGLRTQIERVPYPTGTVQVTLDAVGVPCYEIKEGVAWDNIPFTDE